jgi:hypothetical protein
MVFFDAPIGEACGLFVDEVVDDSHVWTVDCEGALLNELTVTQQQHYLPGACP